jgi:hypothetical protein
VSARWRWETPGPAAALEAAGSVLVILLVICSALVHGSVFDLLVILLVICSANRSACRVRERAATGREPPRTIATRAGVSHGARGAMHTGCQPCAMSTGPSAGSATGRLRAFMVAPCHGWTRARQSA